MLLYLVASSGPSKVPLYIDNFSLVDRGVVTSLQFDMPTLLSKSTTYFPCVGTIVLLYIDNFSLVDRGVVTSLQLDMPTLLSKSTTYFPYVDTIPLLTLFTSIPKK
jgi:hypothetical protein